MKNRPRTFRLSQILSLALFAGAVLIMVAPFRGDSTLTRTTTAGVLPILSTASLAHGLSFQARTSVERVWTSDGSQFRSAVAAKHQRVLRREIVVRKVAVALPKGWEAPRTEWKHLSRETRRQLDEVARHGPREVQVRSTSTLEGNLAMLERMKSGLGWADPEQVEGELRLVVGNGKGAVDGSIEMRPEVVVGRGPLSLHLVGDFYRQTATAAQWAALDEVLDYLELKWGRVRVSLSRGEDGATTIGPLFPEVSFRLALAGRGA